MPPPPFGSPGKYFLFIFFIFQSNVISYSYKKHSFVMTYLRSSQNYVRYCAIFLWIIYAPLSKILRTLLARGKGFGSLGHSAQKVFATFWLKLLLLNTNHNSIAKHGLNWLRK